MVHEIHMGYEMTGKSVYPFMCKMDVYKVIYESSYFRNKHFYYSPSPFFSPLGKGKRRGGSFGYLNLLHASIVEFLISLLFLMRFIQKFTEPFCPEVEGILGMSPLAHSLNNLGFPG